jgi:type I restriction enzyme S subunit
MTPQELKNSILQLAIQGKLVDQRPEEGTAEGLYKEIQGEKQRLINAGLIKKGKALPEITEDKIPFDIPESWKWVHLDNIAVSGLGKTLDKARNTGDFKPYLCSINVYWLGIDLSKVKEARFEQEELPKYKLEKGDLLICEGGDVGRSAIWNSDDTMYYQNALHRVRFHGGIDAYFYKYLLECYKGMGIIDSYSKGMTIKHLVQSALNDMWLPLPPLAEQKRIVAKIEELLPYVDRYEQAWSKLEDFNKRFPGDMQKSILQTAVQGKLVEQRPEEGTGEELYQQIQAEKQRLFKAGSIKKEKPLPEITENEKPFDIPESWKWVRIGTIFSLQAGKNITASDIYKETSDEHSFLCYGGNGIRGYVSSNNRSGHFPIIGRQGALCGNINLANGDFYATEHAVVVDHFQMCDVLWCGYFLRALNLNQYATATAQPGLAVSNIVKVPIPLPPLAEQKRIVAKLEEILPLCEQLT